MVMGGRTLRRASDEFMRDVDSGRGPEWGVNPAGSTPGNGMMEEARMIAGLRKHKGIRRADTREIECGIRGFETF